VTEPPAAPLEGQVALVTGAGHGVGRQVALELGASGMAVALAALSVDDLDEVAAELEATGGQALVIPSDVTDRASVQSLVGRVEGGLGPVDLLVTVAESPGPAVEFLSGDPDDWWRAVEVGLRGSALCAHYVLKRMVPRRRGRIVNVLGDWSLGPAPVFSQVACSEAGVLRLTDSLALASWTYGVSVFAVSAGRAAIEAGPDPDEEAIPRGPDGLEVTGRLVSELATGCADRLTGRFIRAQDDLQELIRRADEIEASDCLQLRLLELAEPPSEEPLPELAEPAGADEAVEGAASAQAAPQGTEAAEHAGGAEAAEGAQEGEEVVRKSASPGDGSPATVEP
jgi:NAD(P)-dependent dehydrogenase (short-subunit alcohol dehydrogenase family)